jgi:lipid II:glycine glycyltransferase (peptidoglycan interpeptide bridge formation enzyme)
MKTITITPEMYPVIIKAYEEKKAKLQEQIKALQNQLKEIDATINEMNSELKRKPEAAERGVRKRGSKTAAGKRKTGTYLKLDYERLVIAALQDASGALELADIQTKIMESQGLDESYAQKVGANVYRILSELKKQNKVASEKVVGTRKVAYRLL